MLIQVFDGTQTFQKLNRQVKIIHIIYKLYRKHQNSYLEKKASYIFKRNREQNINEQTKNKKKEKMFESKESFYPIFITKASACIMFSSR